jgi:hypothetical protein
MDERVDQHPFLDLLTDLAEDERAWQLARYRVIVKARLFVAAGVRPAIVAKVLGLSERTLYRRMAEASALAGDEAGELSATASALAADDQADAEAQDLR